MREAACLGKAGPGHDPWHPPEKPVSVYRALVAEAVAVCVTCPVQVQCGRFGLELLASDYAVAVYGGMAPETLRDIARRIGRPARKVAQHGTRARYVHRADACRCDACRAANARGEAARRAAKRNQRRECEAWNSYGRMCRQPAGVGSVFCDDHAILVPPTVAYEFG